MAYDPQVNAFGRPDGQVRGRPGGIRDGNNSAETLGQIDNRNQLRGDTHSLQLLQPSVGVRAGSVGPFRASLMLFSTQSMYIGTKQDQVQSHTAALIPGNVGIVLTHGDEIWVAGAAGNSYPQIVAVFTETLSA